MEHWVVVATSPDSPDVALYRPEYRNSDHLQDCTILEPHAIESRRIVGLGRCLNPERQTKNLTRNLRTIGRFLVCRINNGTSLI